MLHVKGITKAYASQVILKGISLDLEESRLIAVTGSNGSGKSTLLKGIVGEISFDEGTVAIDKETIIAYLPQHIPDNGMNAQRYLFTARPALAEAFQRIESSENPFVYAEALDRFNTLGGYEFEREIDTNLSYFGFCESDAAKRFAAFSEGEKRLLGIIRLMVSGARLFLLDEPTNHLDIAHCVMLEEYILQKKEQRNAFLLVSHDRAFIDRVADRTLYLERGLSFSVEGGYSALLSHKEQSFSVRARHAEDLQRKIRQLEREIMQKKQWAQKVERTKQNNPHADKGYIGHQSARLAKRATAVTGRLNALVESMKEEKPFVEKPINLSFLDYSVSSRVVIRAEKIEKRFEGRIVLSDVAIDCTTKDRIGIIGENGSGKTTLMRILVNDLTPDAGDCYRNDAVRWLYLPQDIRRFFTHEVLLENMARYGHSEVFVRQALGAARIRNDRVFSKVDELSRGELMRCALVSAILAKTEFLFMDEPTNHLDIESLEVLRSLLEQFDGGVLFISHDRYFIAQQAQTLYGLTRQRLYLMDMEGSRKD